MEDKLGQLRQRFLERCKGNLPALRACHSIFDGATASEQEHFLALVHSMAGTGGIFGFPEISNAAIVLETVLREGEGSIDREMVNSLVDRLVTATCDGGVVAWKLQNYL